MRHKTDRALNAYHQECDAFFAVRSTRGTWYQGPNLPWTYFKGRAALFADESEARRVARSSVTDAPILVRVRDSDF